MAAKWSKPVTREVQTPNGPLNVTLGDDGITICPKGTRRKVNVGWAALLNAGVLPDNAPARAQDDTERRGKWFWK